MKQKYQRFSHFNHARINILGKHLSLLSDSATKLSARKRSKKCYVLKNKLVAIYSTTNYSIYTINPSKLLFYPTGLHDWWIEIPISRLCGRIIAYTEFSLLGFVTSCKPIIRNSRIKYSYF